MRYREFASRLKEDIQAVQDPRDEVTRYSPEDDSISGISIEDERKPKLTLKMLNRLKKIRSTKNLEMSKKQELLGIMYGNGGADEEEI